jgi:hypothetical protein
VGWATFCAIFFKNSSGHPGYLVHSLYHGFLRLLVIDLQSLASCFKDSLPSVIYTHTFLTGIHQTLSIMLCIPTSHWCVIYFLIYKCDRPFIKDSLSRSHLCMYVLMYVGDIMPDELNM